MDIEAVEAMVLEAVTKQQLVKIQQTKDLVCAVVNC
jgi:hypothetical protein